MAKPDALTFTLATEDFDVSLLPSHARDRNTPAFHEAVRVYLQDEFKRFGGWSNVQVDAERIEVSWTPDRQPPDPLEQIVGKLQRGDYSGATTLLQLFLSDRPNDVNLLYNLGMALSDVGRLAEAEEHLQHVVELAPNHVNARVALGVALQRQGRTARALEVLHAAVEHAPDNLWAQRNLGACLLSAGQFHEAERCLREATLIDAGDQQSWYGLAQALERLGKTADADAAYRKTIDVDEYSPTAERARDALREIAQKTFRDRLPGIARPDAIMYCLGAIEKFEKMSQSEVQRIAFEIATRGMKGLNVNDPAQKYRLRSLPGTFSGLHLVCLMYVGFKRFAPEQDIGFDLSKEYATAKSMHEAEPNNQ
jgi:Flp pilus assembly protein TadD